MWKDWFFFSRSQQIGIIILIVIILALLAARMILPSLTATHTVKKDNFEAEANIFLDSLKSLPHGNYTQNYHYNNYAENRHESNFEKLPKPVLSRFNPNTADSLQFVRLGIKPKIASNILKYRKKGGKFRKAEDFQKIWGINEEQMQTLLRYIDIPTETPPIATATLNKTAKTDAIVELNSADTTQLKQVKGIGSGFARRIVGYRKRLGGFVRIDQLREVWGITPEMYAALAPHFSIDKKQVQTIKVNKASIEKLKYHPYLNFYTAKAIYELRLTKGSLKSINDLRTIDILDKDLINKIEPYLSFQ
jgi:DNA uptake protein ComE-like DNA-binding protein